MPRTKRMTRASRKVDENTDPNKESGVDLINPYIKNYDAICKRQLQEMRFSCTETLMAVDFFFQEMKMEIPEAVGNKTLRELREPKEMSIQLMSSTAMGACAAFEVTSSISRIGKKRSMSVTHDEGYLTAETTKSSTESRQSRAKKRAIPRPKRVSRSLSKQNTYLSALTQSSYKTPLTRNRTNSTLLVTPKLKPNDPHVVLRHPKMGETAISMQGSPLMVNPIVSVDANVNIPLRNGTTISIQPKGGLRLSQFPEMDAAVRRQIETLRDNLIQVCQIPQ